MVLAALGLVFAPVGVYLATLEGCIRYLTVVGQQVCTEWGFPYQAPGYALLTLGILLFVAGLVLALREKG